MARAWRIEYEGALYHVLSRGNEQRTIFTETEDRLFDLFPHKTSLDTFKGGLCFDNLYCFH